MTRIKYSKYNNNLLLAGPFISNNEVLTLILYTEILCYTINNSRKEIVKEGQASSLPTLKKKAKKALRELGCTFYDEIRKRPGVEVLKYD